jgi:hypothetical protein
LARFSANSLRNIPCVENQLSLSLKQGFLPFDTLAYQVGLLPKQRILDAIFTPMFSLLLPIANFCTEASIVLQLPLHFAIARPKK